MERKASRYLRQWLGVPRSFSSVNLYSKSSPGALAVGSIVEEYKVSQVRSVLLLQNSRDPIACTTTDKGTRRRKWSPNRAIAEAESNLKFKEIIGVVAKGRQGLGNYSPVVSSSNDTSERRKLIVADVHATEEQGRHVRAVGMAMQGRWTKWDDLEPRKTAMKDLLYQPFLSLSFFLQAMSDTLPSNTNLVRWKKLNDPTCSVCLAKPASLCHVLSTCKTSLTQGRYTWRHDKVLSVLVGEITNFINSGRVRVARQTISFVKEGSRPLRSNTLATTLRAGIVSGANDWVIKADINGRLVFPQEVVVTNLRPDILIPSNSIKTIVLVELTVPWEEKVSERHEFKKSKYDHLAVEAGLKGWSVVNLPVEVGCRGFACKSLSHMWRKLGMSGSSLRKANSKTAREAERCYRWLWLRRNNSDWLSFS